MPKDQFDKWLSQATAGLAVAEKQHLEPELHAHFEDAVADGLEHGLDSQQAITKAISSLGNPSVCNAKYRQLYFTEREYKTLFTPTVINKNNWWIVALMVVATGFIGVKQLLELSSLSALAFPLSQIIIYGAPLLLRYNSPKLFQASETMEDDHHHYQLHRDDLKPSDFATLRISLLCKMLALSLAGVYLLSQSGQELLYYGILGAVDQIFDMIYLALFAIFIYVFINSVALTIKLRRISRHLWGNV
jgi:hypothetical protein